MKNVTILFFVFYKRIYFCKWAFFGNFTMIYFHKLASFKYFVNTLFCIDCNGLNLISRRKYTLFLTFKNTLYHYQDIDNDN